MALLFHGKWAKLAQKKGGPGARSSHAIAVVGLKAYVFGGEFSPRVPVDNHLHVFDLQTLTWSITDASGDIPPPRVGVTMAAVGTTIYVFGGRDSAHNELNEFYSFNTSTNNWSSLSPGPAHRSYHSMTADDDRIYVFGGCGVDGRLNDLWAFDIKDNSWVKFPSPGETLKGRGGPGLAVSSSRDGSKKIWIVYGFAGQETDDVHCFDLVNQVWSQVETTGEKPNPRSVFSAAAIGQYIVVYGGEVDPSDLGHLGAGKFAGDGYALDTKTGVWLRWEDTTDATDHPGPRGWCAYSNARLDGKDGLLVYGGNSPSNDRLDDLFFFTPSLPDGREEVLQAWYMDDSSEDQRLPHHREPKEFVSLDQLAELGVLSWRLDADNYETDKELKKIREDRGYTYTDFCEVCPEKLPNYEEKIKKFFEEHLHTDEEIRYCVAGSGYFDVRDKDEKWIRVWVKKGGLIVLPAGIYHRFTLDTNNYIKAMRLFVGEPVWTPYNRPHDDLPARKGYIGAFVKNDASNTAVGAAA